MKINNLFENKNEKCFENLEHSPICSFSFQVDCTKHSSICKEFGIRGYPTLKWITDGQKVLEYFTSILQLHSFQISCDHYIHPTQKKKKKKKKKKGRAVAQW